VLLLRLQRFHGGEQKHAGEENGEHVRRRHAGEDCANKRPDRRRHFEQHTDANIGVALAHVGCRGTRRRCDDRDERCPDRIPHVDVKQQREHRDDDDPAADSRERPQEPGRE
jgi:hypothetical protein